MPILSLPLVLQRMYSQMQRRLWVHYLSEFRCPCLCLCLYLEDFGGMREVGDLVVLGDHMEDFFSELGQSLNGVG